MSQIKKFTSQFSLIETIAPHLYIAVVGLASIIVPMGLLYMAVYQNFQSWFTENFTQTQTLIIFYGFHIFLVLCAVAVVVYFQYIRRQYKVIVTEDDLTVFNETIVITDIERLTFRLAKDYEYEPTPLKALGEFFSVETSGILSSQSSHFASHRTDRSPGLEIVGRKEGVERNEDIGTYMRSLEKRFMLHILLSLCLCFLVPIIGIFLFIPYLVFMHKRIFKDVHQMFIDISFFGSEGAEIYNEIAEHIAERNNTMKVVGNSARLAKVIKYNAISQYVTVFILTLILCFLCYFLFIYAERGVLAELLFWQNN